MAESQLPQQEQKAARSVDNAKLLGANVVHAYKHRHSGETSRSTQRQPLPKPTDVQLSPGQFWFARYHSLSELTPHEQQNARTLFHMAMARGLSDAQVGCADDLLTDESHINEYDYNESSGAYGAVQALPGDKMAAAGEDWRNNIRTQFKWFFDIYLPSPSHDYQGDPCEAEAHSQAYGWY